MARRIARFSPTALVSALVVVTAAAIYAPLIFNDPFLRRDDAPDVARFEAVRSPGDYLAARARGEIYELLPVRDLSFLVDAGIKRVTGFSPFHLTNVLLGLGCFALTLSLALRLSPWPLAATVFAALAFLHPVTAASIAWISARKHLLATLFALAATRELLTQAPPKGAVNRRALGFYGLSLLSHPILVLWPLWAWLYGRLGTRSRNEARSIERTAQAALVPLLAVAALSLWYYTGPYVGVTGRGKLALGAPFEPVVHLLAFGRYIGNLLFPFRVASVYYTGGLMGVAGLLVFPLAAFVAMKVLGAKRALAWLTLVLLGPVFMSAVPTNIFVSDTYALSSVFFFAIAAAAALPQRQPRSARAKTAAVFAASLLAASFFWGSLGVARAHVSDAALYERAYLLDPSPESLAIHIDLTLLDGGHIKEAVVESMRLNRWDPANLHGPHLLAKSVFLDVETPVAGRIRFLESRPRQDEWSLYFTGRLYAADRKYAKAYELEKRALSSGSDFFGARASVTAAMLEDCRKAGRRDCGQPFD